MLLNQKKEGIIVDLSLESGEILKNAEENSVILKAFLLTHSHFDHILGFNLIDVKSLLKNGVKIYAHQNAAQFLLSGKINPPDWNYQGELPIFKEEEIVFFDDDAEFSVGEFFIKTVFVPGHSVDAVCYIINDEYLFTGDTMFRNSFGPVNIPGADGQELEKSIEKLKTLPGKLRVFPGHGKYDFTLAERFAEL